MATQDLYVGDGTTVLYPITFPYIDATDVLASLDGTDTTAYSLANTTTLEFDAAPANGVAIRIYRETTVDVAKATFFPGSAIRAQDLNDNFEQNLFVVQEATFDNSQSAIDSAAARTAADAAVVTADTALTQSAAAEISAAQAQTDATQAAADAAQAQTDATTAATAASSAQISANQANTAVQSAAIFAPVANVAAIPTTPSDQDRVSVLDSTGIASFTPLTGLPVGPSYNSGSFVNLIYQTAQTTWDYVAYGVTDPDARYITPAILQDSLTDATSASPGLVETATQAEVITGTDTFRYVTPATLKGLSSTQGRAGIVELATGLEARAGADGTKALSPTTGHYTYVQKLGDTMLGNLTAPIVKATDHMEGVAERHELTFSNSEEELAIPTWCRRIEIGYENAISNAVVGAPYPFETRLKKGTGTDYGTLTDIGNVVSRTWTSSDIVFTAATPYWRLFLPGPAGTAASINRGTGTIYLNPNGSLWTATGTYTGINIVDSSGIPTTVSASGWGNMGDRPTILSFFTTAISTNLIVVNFLSE